MITQKMIDQLKEDIGFWFDDYLLNKGDGCQDDTNEWYLQFEAVFNAAYGVGNWLLIDEKI